ncbi:Imm1 family immunity protein [Streptomyces sp. NPDC127114]|uniref:Imm1 family immunity protein n=1 Tax=Streptomyces sp. NPDC127114 TaxID=3345366 RepID=UPI00363FFA1F
MVHGTYRYAETWAEMASLISEVMDNLQYERSDSPWVDPGEVATLMFADRKHSEDVHDWWPDNYLQVSVNTQSGYGGLVWFATQDRAAKDEISEHIWVSDNPNPPALDPRVVSDPGVPYFFDPRSTLPSGKIREAVEEFCRSGTGNRPECVAWVHGEMNGQRHS